MKQKFTILFDLDGTLVDTAPDLMSAHNHVMKKYDFAEMNVGSAVPSMTTKLLNAMDLITPSEETLKLFDKEIENFLESNNYQLIEKRKAA